MTIAVLGDENAKRAFAEKGVPEGVELLWCGSLKTLVATVADAYFDLVFVNEKERIHQYSMRKGFPFFVNCVEFRSGDISPFIVRFNGWNSFFDRSIIELVITDSIQAEWVGKVFDQLKWKYSVVPDIPGMISARIVAAIINEAYYTVGDGVSSEEEVDIAMKLGTNYPFGPFEWAKIIGIKNVFSLLSEMNKEDQRLTIAPALEKIIENQQNQ